MRTKHADEKMDGIYLDLFEHDKDDLSQSRSFFLVILWMEEILHQLPVVYGLSHCNPIIYSVL